MGNRMVLCRQKMGTLRPNTLALVPALIILSASPALGQRRPAPQGTRGGSHRVVRTVAGCFTAEYPGRVRRESGAAKENPFLQATRYLKGPALSVAYTSPQSRAERDSWSEASVALAKLAPGTQVIVERLLQKELHLRFKRHNGKDIAPIAVSTGSGGTSTARGEIVLTRTHLYRVLAVGPTAQASKEFIESVAPASCSRR